MSRFGSLFLAGAGCVALAFGCGEKDLQPDPNATGGTIATGGVVATGGVTVPSVDGDVVPALDAGATVSTGGTVAPAGPVYTNDIDLFLTKYCTMCHDTGGSAPPAMDTYASAKASAVKSNDTLVDGSMPPGSKKPSAAEKTRFADWIKAGMPQ